MEHVPRQRDKYAERQRGKHARRLRGEARQLANEVWQASKYAESRISGTRQTHVEQRLMIAP